MIHRYPLAYNPILEYWELIESGKETVSHKVRVFYEYQAKRILQPDPAAEFVYSPRRALHAIEFIEGYCRHSKGSAGGKPFLMEVWQRAFTACIFGWIDDSGFRQYQEALMIVGKKNGKSTLAAGIGLYMMVADGEPGAEVYAVATKRDQAKIIWNEASRMVKKSGYLHYTRENQRGVIRTKVGELTADYNDSVFKPLGRDSDTQDGLNVHCALLDEIHAWPQSLRDLYTIVTDGVTARDQPLILETTTAGVVREAIYDEQYDRAEKKINAMEEGREVDVHFMPVIYELDNKDTWKDPEHWKEANPGLGTIKKKKQLADKVARAIANPKAVRNLLTKEFNIPETGSESWLSFSELNNQETFDIAAMRPRYGIGGTDLSSTTDLTAAVVIFRVPEDQTVYVLSMFWIPEDLVDKRTKEDQIPYDVWIKQGFMRTCAGNHVDAGAHGKAQGRKAGTCGEHEPDLVELALHLGVDHKGGAERDAGCLAHGVFAGIGHERGKHFLDGGGKVVVAGCHLGAAEDAAVPADDGIGVRAAGIYTQCCCSPVHVVLPWRSSVLKAPQALRRRPP